MDKRKVQTYTPECRTEMAKLVMEQGLSLTKTATHLLMNQGTLAYWLTQAHHVVKSVSPVAGAQGHSELAEERYLEKATAYLPSESLSGTRSKSNGN